MQMQDVVVIGGGAGGLTVASGIAQLGLKVTLIEKSNKLGGDCLHYGCVPSKSFIRAAKVKHMLENALDFGISSHSYPTELDNVNKYVQSVINKIQKYDSPEKFEKLGVNILFGDCKFINNNTIAFGTTLINSKKFVIATGSRARIPNIPGLEDIDYLTNETVFKLQKLPASLTIIGGGAIGLEMGQAFSRLGSRVRIVERSGRCLPRLDKDISKILSKILHEEGIEILFNAEVKECLNQGKDKIVICSNAVSSSKEIILGSDEVLVATGVVPNVENLNLSKVEVDYNERGITIDNRMRTSAKNIYAIGNVTKVPGKFTHNAEYQAGIVISNIAFKLPIKANYDYIPAVFYTDPQIAHIGVTEQNLIDNKIENYQVLHTEFSEVDRALTDNVSEGKMKIIINKGKIIGCTIIGEGAGELIGEISLAIKAKISIETLATTIHPYPTLSQIIRKTANTYYKDILFSPKIKKIVKFLQKIIPW